MPAVRKPVALPGSESAGVAEALAGAPTGNLGGDVKESEGPWEGGWGTDWVSRAVKSTELGEGEQVSKGEQKRGELRGKCLHLGKEALAQAI